MATQGCPCGFAGHPRKPCRCTPRQVQLYRARLSGPLLDRIDMHVEVPVVAARDLTRGVRRGRSAADGLAPRAGRAGRADVATTDSDAAAPETSAVTRARVVAARRVQAERFASRPSIHANAQMDLPDVETFCRVDDATRALLHKAMESFSMSARATHRVLRVARTIADLVDAGEIAIEHVAEAVQYQALERREV